MHLLQRMHKFYQTGCKHEEWCQNLFEIPISTLLWDMCGRYAFCIRRITDILHLKAPYNAGCLFKILTLKRYVILIN